MNEFEQLPSAKMNASTRMAELTSILACALIRTFVSSDASVTACQADTKSKRTNDKVGGNGAKRGGHDRRVTVTPDDPFDCEDLTTDTTKAGLKKIEDEIDIGSTECYI